MLIVELTLTLMFCEHYRKMIHYFLLYQHLCHSSIKVLFNSASRILLSLVTKLLNNT
jgi:hypothetical protein